MTDLMTDLGDGYVLDDDASRIDVTQAADLLVAHTYWAAARPRAAVERAIRNAFRKVGLYHDGVLVGFARAVSDGEIVAYLADVVVHPDHRGRGLGVELVRSVVDGGPIAHVRWMLHTNDAHGLYRKLGFAETDQRYMERAHRGWELGVNPACD